MKTTINFGKIDYNNIGKKVNTIIVDIELKDRNGLPCFSVSGGIVNESRRDYESCGQILDDLVEYLSDNELFMTIHRLWKLYHLNDLNVGTVRQTEEIEEWVKEGNEYSYNKACEYLKSINLYEDDGYRYGSAWLYREIPSKDLQLIKDIIETNSLMSYSIE